MHVKKKKGGQFIDNLKRTHFPPNENTLKHTHTVCVSVCVCVCVCVCVQHRKL